MEKLVFEQLAGSGFQAKKCGMAGLTGKNGRESGI